jgi:hypothetical protein
MTADQLSGPVILFLLHDSCAKNKNNTQVSTILFVLCLLGKFGLMSSRKM